jgi:saccharopine dehydrogenase-like NADP-dependent oxidoreductase
MIMKLLSIGCGYIGSVLAEELVRHLDFDRLIICDNETARIERIVNRLGEKVQCFQLDLSKYTNLLKIIDEADVVIGLSPGRLGFNIVKACVEQQKSLVDLSYMGEDPLVFHQEAVERGIVIIPDCGVAPGLSNLLVGQAATHLDEVEDVIIYVGGLPQNPQPPLNYKVTWCVEDLFEEYTRKVSIVKNHKLVEVEALEGVETVAFEGIRPLEAFFTDGVRTLQHTIRAKNVWEKTLRYPGHVEKIKFLINLGLLSKDRLRTIPISPWEFMRNFWTEKLSLFDEKDVVLMRVIITGRKASTHLQHTFEVVDYFDEKRNITAMARTTAYTAFAVIKLLTENKIAEHGVIPPEILGMNHTLFHEIETLLKERNIHITKSLRQLT